MTPFTDVFPLRDKPVKTRAWSREQVIDAIQRFEREHGRPPQARDWRVADKERNYPNFKAVYRSAGRRTAPFGQWSEALEAAGLLTVRVVKRSPEAIQRARETMERKRLEKAAQLCFDLAPAKPRLIAVRPKPRGPISAHELIRVRDCQAYACPYEAETGQDACRLHLLAETG